MMQEKRDDRGEKKRWHAQWLFFLLMLLVPFTCAWADTPDTTATPQVISSIDIEPGIPSPGDDSLSPIIPADSLVLKPLMREDPVGTPPGAIAVSAMGAASYTLAIEAPDGGALTPHLALSYNSLLGGYGLAGYGFGLTGLSAITRGGSDLFHDGAQRGVTHTTADNLLLDGKRLVLLSGTRGRDGATYTVEGDPYTRVTAHGDDEWFEVATPSGMTCEYGRTAGSRLAYTDFDGDGFPELANCGTALNDACDAESGKVHFYRTGGDLSQAGRLTAVTDGLGATTAIRYAFATSPAVYTRSTGGSYPVNTYTLPIPVEIRNYF